MSKRAEYMLLFRVAMIGFLLLMALPGRQEGLPETLLGFAPVVVAVPVLVSLERRPALRPFVTIAWVLVFDLVVVGFMAATLGEVADPDVLGFLLLGVVIATARDLVAGGLTGTMAAAGFLYLAQQQQISAAFPDSGLLPQASLFLVAGLFAGYLSREAEQERRERDVQTAELRQELAGLGEHLRNVLASVNSGVLATDEDERVRTYNRAAERILGVPSHHVIGRPFAELEALSSLQDLVRGARYPAAGSAARSDLDFVRPDGTTVRVGYSLTPLEDLAGRRIGWILVFQDVTLVRDYEARMLRQEQLAALGRLVSGIAHEFGNLLGGARGHVDLALAGGPDDAVEILPTVRDTLSRALEMIESLLRFARGTPLHPTTGVSLPDVLGRALHLLKVELERHEVDVERAWRDVAPVQADAAQLEQVFVNVILNAAHALSDQPERRLRISVTEDDRHVEVVFEDSGPGIPSEIRDRIFEPFFTTKGALGGSAVPGTGLGLATALGVVEAHGGQLIAGDSKDFGGTRVAVRLPSTDGDAR